MHSKNRLRSHYLFTFPITLIYTIFFILPLVLGIYYSFTNWNGIATEFKFVGLANFRRILSDSRALGTVWFTVRYAVMLCIATVGISLALGLLLNQAFRGKAFLKSVYFYPAVMSPMIIGLIFNEIYYRALPGIGEALGIGILSKSLISSPGTAIFAILIANVWQSVAIPTAIIIAGLQSIPTYLYEAASIDGANAFQRFRMITLPFLAPTLTIVLVLAIKDGLLVFDYILAITNGAPAGTTHSFGTFIYYQAFQTYDYAFAVANSVVLFIFIALFGALQIKLMKRLEAKE